MTLYQYHVFERFLKIVLEMCGIDIIAALLLLSLELLKCRNREKRYIG